MFRLSFFRKRPLVPVLREGGTLDLGNADHVVWFAYVVCNQMHFWFHHTTCFGGHINRERQVPICRMRKPTPPRDAYSVNAAGLVLHPVSKLDQWYVAAIWMTMAANIGNNDGKLSTSWAPAW